MTGCYNPEYTEEDCEGMLLGLAVNELLPGPPNATEAEKAALIAQGREMFSTFYLYYGSGSGTGIVGQVADFYLALCATELLEAEKCHGKSNWIRKMDGRM